MMKIKTILAAAVAVISLTACEDLFEDGSLQPDGSKPSVTINNPTTNQAVTQVQGVRVSITTVDKDKVKDIEVVIRGVESEQPYVSFKKFPNKNVVELDTLIALPNAVAGSYVLVVNATDMRTNLAREEVSFKIK